MDFINEDSFHRTLLTKLLFRLRGKWHKILIDKNSTAIPLEMILFLQSKVKFVNLIFFFNLIFYQIFARKLIKKKKKIISSLINIFNKSLSSDVAWDGTFQERKLVSGRIKLGRDFKTSRLTILKHEYKFGEGRWVGKSRGIILLRLARPEALPKIKAGVVDGWSDDERWKIS